MASRIFEQLKDWKDFERFCADLLTAEGFIIESEPFVDRTGTDFLAVEEYRSHDPNRIIRVRWRVQCKHYAGSGTNLGRKEVEESINSYETTRAVDEGLFIIVDTDYSEIAKEVIDKYVINHPDAKITLWNQRLLLSRLERHNNLSLRYGLSLPSHDYHSVFTPLADLGAKKVLMISDQSALAHHMTSALRSVGFKVTFLSVWNYLSASRLDFARRSVLKEDFHLIVSFLGDTFGSLLPSTLSDLLLQRSKSGTSFLFFPFFAWSLNQGMYSDLSDLIPVRLKNTANDAEEQNLQLIAGPSRHGDFRWLLSFDSFAENAYTELDPTSGQQPFTDGISSRFGLSHSFEYLDITQGSTLVWSDTTGNPMVVTREQSKSKICYVNTCCHSCVYPTAISSPLEASPETTRLFRNIVQWLLTGECNAT